MVKITKDLAEKLLDNTNDLLEDIKAFRKYPRYEKRCQEYEKEIAELKAAIERESDDKNARQRL